MAIIETVTSSRFVDTMTTRGNFSREGAEVLFMYLEDTGEDIEMDAVAFRCDYAEESIDALADEYEIKTDKDEDDKREQVREYLEERTTICGETSDGFVYAQF